MVNVKWFISQRYELCLAIRLWGTSGREHLKWCDDRKSPGVKTLVGAEGGSDRERGGIESKVEAVGLRRVRK